MADLRSGRPPKALSPLLGIFITVLIDMLGFGLVIPDIQLRAKELYGGEGPMIGLAIASFSLAQLIATPLLGRLSDRVGRRKILFLTTLLSAVSFLFYAHATSLWVIFVARILAGVAGANLGVAYAYVADISTPQDRARSMGLIGAAFGLGFIFGPVLGSFLVMLGGGSPLVLGYTAAGLGFLNFLYVIFLLPEPPRAARAPSLGWKRDLQVALSSPNLAVMLFMLFVFNFGFANLHATFFQLLTSPRGIFRLAETDEALVRLWSDPSGHRLAQMLPAMLEDGRAAGALILMFIGFVSAMVQGGLIRRLSPKFGEVRLVRWALWTLVPAFLLIPVTPLWLPALGLWAAFAFATGVLQPCLSSLISQEAPAEMQGGVFGLTQSLNAGARVLGPLLGNVLFPLGPGLPYLAAASLVAVAGVTALRLRRVEAFGEV